MERLRGEMGRQRSPPGLDELSDRRGGVAEEPCVWSLLLVWLRNLTAAMLTRWGPNGGTLPSSRSLRYFVLEMYGCGLAMQAAWRGVFLAAWFCFDFGTLWGL